VDSKDASDWIKRHTMMESDGEHCSGTRWNGTTEDTKVIVHNDITNKWTGNPLTQVTQKIDSKTAREPNEHHQHIKAVVSSRTESAAATKLLHFLI